MAMERAGIAEPPVMPMEATTGVAMLLLRRRCDGFSSSVLAPRADFGEGAELSTFLWNM